MARNSSMAKRRKKALPYPSDVGKKAPKCATPKGICLSKLLPGTGFDWPTVGEMHNLRPDLNKDYVYRIQDALKHTYGRLIYIPKFDQEMSQVIVRGTDMDDMSVTDTDPIKFWTKVQQSFVNDHSFVNHPRITPETLHAFVAYALEARELSQTSAKKNNPKAEGNLAKAVDALWNEFAHEPFAETREAYEERPDEARWFGRKEEEDPTTEDGGDEMDIDGPETAELDPKLAENFAVMENKMETVFLGMKMELVMLPKSQIDG